jgi:hypothetical protein
VLQREFGVEPDDQIVIAAPSFQRLTGGKVNNYREGDEELYVFSKQFVGVATELVAGGGDKSTLPSTDGVVGVLASLGRLGDVKEALLGKSGLTSFDPERVREALARVAPWFSSSESAELEHERQAWEKTVGTSTGWETDSVSVSSSGSPLLAALPAYRLRLRLLHLAAAVYRQTVAERAGRSKDVEQRAIESCRCAQAAANNLSRLRGSVQAKIKHLLSSVVPRLARWKHLAGNVDGYLKRLEGIHLCAPLCSEGHRTLGDTVPSAAIRRWAKQCLEGCRRLQEDVDRLSEELSRFDADTATFLAFFRSSSPTVVASSTAVAPASSNATTDSFDAASVFAAMEEATAALTTTRDKTENQARSLMRATRDAVLMAEEAASLAEGSPTSSSSAVLETIRTLEQLSAKALSTELPGLVALDKEACDLQDKVLEQTVGCRWVLARSLASVSRLQDMTVSLSSSRRTVESAAHVLERQCGEIEHLRALPHAYSAAVTEVVRRRLFVDAMTAEVREAMERLGRLRAEEASQRDAFNARVGQHLPQGLFPGLQERPMHVEVRCFPRTTALPELSPEDADEAADQVEGLEGVGKGSFLGASRAVASSPDDPTSRAMRAVQTADEAEARRVRELQLENSRLKSQMRALVSLLKPTVEADDEREADVSSSSEEDLSPTVRRSMVVKHPVVSRLQGQPGVGGWGGTLPTENASQARSAMSESGVPMTAPALPSVGGSDNDESSPGTKEHLPKAVGPPTSPGPHGRADLTRESPLRGKGVSGGSSPHGSGFEPASHDAAAAEVVLATRAVEYGKHIHDLETQVAAARDELLGWERLHYGEEVAVSGGDEDDEEVEVVIAAAIAAPPALTRVPRTMEAGLALFRDSIRLTHVTPDRRHRVRESSGSVGAHEEFPLPPPEVLSESPRPPTRKGGLNGSSTTASREDRELITDVESLATTQLPSEPSHLPAADKLHRGVSAPVGGLARGSPEPEPAAVDRPPVRLRHVSGSSPGLARAGRLAELAEALRSPDSRPESGARKVAQQLKKCISLSQNLASMLQVYRSKALERVSFLSFAPEDLALFLPAGRFCAVSGEPVYVAFHFNCPRLYLDTQAVTCARMGGPVSPDLILLRIKSIVSRRAKGEGGLGNPFNIQSGLPYWIAAGDIQYTLTQGVVRTSPMLGPAPPPESLPPPTMSVSD